MGSNVLSFLPTGGRSSLSLFIAVKTNDGDIAMLQALSPRVMRWSDDVWLCDLRSCEGYWRAQAEAQGLDEITLLRKVLQASFEEVRASRGEAATGSTAKVEHTWSAAAAAHPWPAVLLATQLSERGLPGLLSLSSPVGQNLYREVSWSSWFSCVKQLGVHLHQVKRQDMLQRSLLQMERAVQRLGLLGPSALRGMDPMAIRRRFGATLHEVWTWEGDSVTEAQTLDAFPWIGTTQPEVPHLTRHLEFPLCEWDHMQPLLKEDLDRLCALDSWYGNERVLSLEWQLVFSDLTCLTLPVCFRHPHHLHSELGHHKTALLQALYSFNGARPGSCLDRARLNQYLPTIPVTSWHLAVSERLVLPKKVRDLFGHQESGFGEAGQDERLHALLQLENKLPLKLEAYDLRKDWVPEDSFRAPPRELAERVDKPGVDAHLSLRELGRVRPLFIYRNPQLFHSGGRSTVWRFSERTMHKWWGPVVEGAARVLQRDYYLLSDDEKQKLWVYKDNQGKCYVHGVFA